MTSGFKFQATCALLSLLPALAPGQDAASQREARERWFLRGRLGTTATARAGSNRARPRAATASVSTADGWTPVGPLPLTADSASGQSNYVAGRVTSIAVDPNDPNGNTIYAGGAFGGVWKSTNAGPATPNAANVTWKALTDDQSTLAIGAIAVQPGGPVVLAGTGETNSSVDSYYGLGILRSGDSGSTWALIPQDQSGHSFTGVGFSKIVFSNDSPSLVVAGTAGTSQGGIDGLSVTANLGIYYSNDAGATWKRAVIRDGGTPIAPGSITSLVYNDVTKTFFAAVRFHGFYSSTDGAFWLRLANQPGDVQLAASACPVSGSPDCPIYRGELAAVPGRNEIYAWYVDDDDVDMGISRSFDGGASPWQPLVDTAISACGDLLGCGTEDGSYNLTLAAVPDGVNPGQTDIYAGAVNLYKCRTVNQTADCSGTGANTFLNLTHASGCAASGVHAAQHGTSFLQVANNTQAVMYFANDGGVYRSLDGYSGLISGSCATANNFDSLNQNLGSLTQFVSLAQHPAEANTMLGGAPVTGFAGTAQALSSSGWQSVNSGEGGFTAINPANPDEWFTENSGVSVQRCPFGIACRSSDFAAGQVISSATLGGDVGPFYTPFLLDNTPGEIVVGTCRVWRGQSDGSGFAPLSVNFETGSSAGCIGTETNQVRAMAAFQVADGSFPEIFYAGTDGFGPLVTSGPIGGHVWVSDPSDPTSWNDRTGIINPKHFPVSAIAIDPFDAQTDPASGTAGQAAYVALTGYGTGSHVWKTVNGGVTWMAFDGLDPHALPDVPANTLVVDSNTQGGLIYAGTDQGVFVANTNDPNGVTWLPVGGGVGGKLPNVPVTALQIFNDGATKLLRAATYGRGVWQFVLASSPDFQVSLPSPSQTTLVGQVALFAGKLSALNGYASGVGLTCVVTGSPQCNVTPGQITSFANPAFEVAASAPLGNYTLKLHAFGSDAKGIIHDTSLSLKVVDFGLGAPSPAAATVKRGNASGALALSLTALGSFNGAVKLSCLGLPAGASCSFSPSSSVSPVSGTPVAVTMTIATSATTQIGTVAITVDGAALGGHRTQAVSLNVVANPDFKITAANRSFTANVGDAVTFGVTVTALDGFASAVNLSCGSGAPPICALAPGSLTPGGNGTLASVTLQSNQAGNYSFNISGITAGATPLSRTVAMNFGATVFDFDLVNSTGPATIRAGQTATYTLQVAPQSPATTFPSNLTFSACTGVPPLSTCTVTPSKIAAASGSASVTVTVTTTAAVLASSGHGGLVFAFCLPGLALLIPAGRVRRAGIGLILMTAVFASCGGGGLTGNSGTGSGGGSGAGLPGTAPGDYTIGVSATPSSGGTGHGAMLSLKVT